MFFSFEKSIEISSSSFSAFASDSFSLSDTYSRVWSSIKELTEAFSLSDGDFVNFTRILSDNFSFSDSALKSSSRELTESLTLTDDITDALLAGISSWEELDDMRNGLAGDYILLNSLDADSANYADYAGPSANAGAGWLPVGTIEGPFTGTFDGGDNTEMLKRFY